MPTNARSRARIGTALAVLIALGVLLLIPASVWVIQATVRPLRLEPGDSLAIDCPTRVRPTQQGASLVVVCEQVPGPPSAAVAPPPISGLEQPLVNEECPDWLHDRYVAAGPDGLRYPTWHPPADPEFGCFFSHEHGSNPAHYVGLASSGPPLFGYTAAQHGVSEPHNGFKVYVTNNDLNGRAWMITVHQGSGGPRRAAEQFHTLDWHISALDGSALVDLHLLGDFGYARPNCRTGEAIPGSGRGRQFSPHDPARRSIPTTDCVSQTVYESWRAVVDVAGYFQASPNFDIDNPTTVINLANLDEVRFMCEFKSPDEDCRGPASATQWSGNKRSVIGPGQLVRSRPGSPWVLTDVFGRRVGSDSEGRRGVIRQYIATTGWDTRKYVGNEVVFSIQSYSDSVYIANPDPVNALAEFGAGHHRWPN